MASYPAYPELWALVTAEFEAHRLPDGSQDIGTAAPEHGSQSDSAALWAELAVGTLE